MTGCRNVFEITPWPSCLPGTPRGNSIQNAAVLGKYESTRKIYYRDGKPLKPGDIFYNKDLFDREGIAYPDSSWTFEGKHLDAAKRLTKREGDPAPGATRGAGNDGNEGRDSGHERAGRW